MNFFTVMLYWGYFLYFIMIPEFFEYSTKARNVTFIKELDNLLGKTCSTENTVLTSLNVVAACGRRCKWYMWTLIGKIALLHMTSTRKISLSSWDYYESSIPSMLWKKEKKRKDYISENIGITAEVVEQ
jgi:hypothetical protein